MRALAAALLLFLGAVLIYGNTQLPARAAPDAVIHTRVADHYTANAYADMRTPNAVTAVLADYRGYDTLGESVVVFIAGIGVVLILQRGLTSRE